MDQASKDALIARAEKIQSVGGSLLSNASLLKAAVEAIPVDGAPPVVVVEPDPPTPPPEPPPAAEYGPSDDLTVVSGDVVLDDVSGIEGKRITGDLYLARSNLTVENCRVDGSILVNRKPGGNYFYPVMKGLTVRNSSSRGIWTLGCSGLTLDGYDALPQANTLAQIIGATTNSGQFCQVENLTVVNSRFSGLQAYRGSKEPHFEAFHLFSCQGATIRGNRFDYVAPDDTTFARITAAVVFETRHDWCTDIVFEDNDVFGGGKYQVYLTMQGKSSIAGNRFHSYAGMSGVQWWDGRPGVAFAQSGNTLDGDPITFKTNA